MKKKQATFKVATLQRCGTFAILQCSFSGGSEQYESFGECAESAFSKAALCPSESAIAAFDGRRLSKVLLRYS